MNRQQLEREFLRLRDLATSGNQLAGGALHNAVIAIVKAAYPRHAVPSQYFDDPAGMMGEVVGLCYRPSVDDRTVQMLLNIMSVCRNIAGNER